MHGLGWPKQIQIQNLTPKIQKTGFSMTKEKCIESEICCATALEMYWKFQWKTSW